MSEAFETYLLPPSKNDLRLVLSFVVGRGGAGRRGAPRSQRHDAAGFRGRCRLPSGARAGRRTFTGAERFASSPRAKTRRTRRVRLFTNFIASARRFRALLAGRCVSGEMIGRRLSGRAPMRETDAKRAGRCGATRSVVLRYPVRSAPDQACDAGVPASGDRKCMISAIFCRCNVPHSQSGISARASVIPNAVIV